LFHQRLVVVAQRKSNARDRQAVLIFFPRERHPVALLRQHFAADLQARLMIVFFHFAQQRLAPQAAIAGLGGRPRLRQRTLPHVGVTAEEILVGVVVIPVFGDRERRRALVPADLVLHQSVHALVGLHHQVLADQPGAVGQS